MIFVELKRQGLAMPPHSFLFGHLKVFDEVGKTMPSDCHGHVFIKEIRRAYTDLPNTFYLDLWPFGEQMLVTASSEIAHQFTQEHSLPKFEFLKEFLAPLVGQTSLVTMEATELNKAGDI
ncbi:hypothetical protein MMC13_004239 [Lambiella insularis]|nr:hypothetical protein [Lambiella insularis]